MSLVKGCVVVAVALVAGSWADPARADEAYVCDGGRIAYVKPGQLDAMKQLDPCIAKYFEATPRVERGTPQPVSTIATGATTTGSTAVPLPPPSTGDYRNVRIINAASAADAIFRHRY